MKKYLSALVGMVCLSFTLISLLRSEYHRPVNNPPSPHIIPDEHRFFYSFVIEIRPTPTEQEYRLKLRDRWYSVIECREGSIMASVGNGWYRCTVGVTIPMITITQEINGRSHMMNEAEVRIYQLTSDGLRQTVPINYTSGPLSRY